MSFPKNKIIIIGNFALVYEQYVNYAGILCDLYTIKETKPTGHIMNYPMIVPTKIRNKEPGSKTNFTNEPTLDEMMDFLSDFIKIHDLQQIPQQKNRN